MGSRTPSGRRTSVARRLARARKYGWVYLAHNKETGRALAIKKIKEGRPVAPPSSTAATDMSTGGRWHLLHSHPGGHAPKGAMPREHRASGGSPRQPSRCFLVLGLRACRTRPV
ncbi:hypothetical protein HaLaN_08000 [Haematococcus lacustris]|uniref:Uncharacterized protein n=1 Tax=Haematococcus lacustris TaxID=44745 RepID=A0A699YXX3_HAELA|nr:hypothetical protein HaLaN_08000 [Haematococcus lacustris]